MRTIIAGSRGIVDRDALDACMAQAAEEGIVPTVVLSGTARGVDRLGEEWATKRGIPVERWPADWKQHGRSAGIRRNKEMAQEADALVALWDGKSRGTRHMINHAESVGLKVYWETP